MRGAQADRVTENAVRVYHDRENPRAELLTGDHIGGYGRKVEERDLAASAGSNNGVGRDLVHDFGAWYHIVSK